MTAGPAVGGRPTSNGTMAQWAQRLQRMQGSSRKHLTELALYAARIELALARRVRLPPANKPEPGPGHT